MSMERTRRTRDTRSFDEKALSSKWENCDVCGHLWSVVAFVVICGRLWRLWSFVVVCGVCGCFNFTSF